MNSTRGRSHRTQSACRGSMLRVPASPQTEAASTCVPTFTPTRAADVTRERIRSQKVGRYADGGDGDPSPCLQCTQVCKQKRMHEQCSRRWRRCCTTTCTRAVTHSFAFNLLTLLGRFTLRTIQGERGAFSAARESARQNGRQRKRARPPLISST